MIGAVKPWSGRAASDALARVKAEGQRKRTPCCICRMPINYRLEYPDPDSCSVQHVKSRKHYPHLVWSPSNWAPAHLGCNQSQGARADEGLGVVSEEW